MDICHRSWSSTVMSSSELGSSPTESDDAEWAHIAHDLDTSPGAREPAGLEACIGRALRARKPYAAARELGMSLRTYRRRVAELLAGLDPASRLQAGIRAGAPALTR